MNRPLAAIAVLTLIVGCQNPSQSRESQLALGENSTLPRQLKIISNVASIDLAEIKIDTSWAIIKINITSSKRTPDGVYEDGVFRSLHSELIVTATADLVYSLSNQPIKNGVWDITWRRPDAVVNPPNDSQAAYNHPGVYLAMLNPAGEIRLDSLRMIPDAWSTKLMQAALWVRDNPDILAVDGRGESIFLDNPNPFISLHAWRLLVNTKQPSTQVIVRQLSHADAVVQAASLVILCGGDESKSQESLAAIRTAIDDAKSADDVLGLALGAAAYYGPAQRFSGLDPCVDEVLRKIQSRPALMLDASPAGDTVRDIVNANKSRWERFPFKKDRLF